jgi:enhancer of polycomb-like protein
MDEEDEVALKHINATLPRGFPECSEDLFEDVMNFFDETAQNKQPFAAVDNPPILPLDELEEQFDETITREIRTYAKFIYEHWHARRSATGNRGLSPRLKFETGQDTDDADPYVCFRRRELRQIRKTRNRDAQSAEKLRKMRKELEDARQLLAMVKQREMIRKEVLNIDRTLFQQRAEVKETKRKLGIKGDDEDLVNQKVATLLFLFFVWITETDFNLAQEANRRSQSWPASLATTIAASA